MKQLYPSFKSNIQRHHLLVDVQTVILAFSGGKDSVTLLVLLRELSREIPFRLVAAYFNHRLRPDADAEERWVRDFCRQSGVELVVGSADVPGFKNEQGLNLEHAASLLRYRFLDETASIYPAPCVATAHTGSDITETFLIKLLRGSGNRGLSAIYSRKEPRVIRPLLEFGQEEILAFLDRNDIGYYQDSTNLETHFLRNKIRHDILPRLREIEPSVDRNVYRSSMIFQQEYDYFKSRANEFLDRHLILGRILPTAPLADQHLAMRRHIVREVIRRWKGDLLEIGFHHVEGILGHLDRPEATNLPGLDLIMRKGFLWPRNLVLPPYSYVVEGPGNIAIPEAGIEIRVGIVDDFEKPANHFSAILPHRLFPFPFEIRNPRQGDRYVKLHSDFHQTVFEMIRSSGLPSELRHLRPVVAMAGGEPVWVAGSPAAESVQVRDMEPGPFVTISVLS